ncbi:hypothetical protein BB561_006197 [Smittium simulii]|uniref:Uncharacterized protein n=1 Tax=Smittium simulii TaxID=133385 RepID=A0A2T9Y5Z7_9FUNG|nr:hypothetical protein BB561_006197 [Smittium simulii]
MHNSSYKQQIFDPQLIELLTRSKDTPIYKAQAIGATLAAQAEESADNVVNHAFWSPSSQLSITGTHPWEDVSCCFEPPGSVYESESGEAKGFDEKKLYKFQRNKCEATYSGEIKYFLLREKFGSNTRNQNWNQLWSATDPPFTTSTLYYPKEDGRPSFGSRSPKAQQLCRKKIFQNGVPQIHLYYDTEEGLHNLPQPPRRIPTYSNLPEHPKNVTQSSEKQYSRLEKGGVNIIEYGSDFNKKSSKLYWKSSINVYCSTSRKAYAETPYRIEELRTEDNQIKNYLLQWNRQSFIPESPELEIFTDSSNETWGIVIIDKKYPGSWPTDLINTHINFTKLLTEHDVTSSNGQICISLYRQSNSLIICKKIWGDNTEGALKDFGRIMATLPEDKYISICDKSEHQDNQILQLVSELLCNRDQRSLSFMGMLDKSLLFSTLELDSASTTEGETRENNTDAGDALVKVCNVVSGPNSTNNRHTFDSTRVQNCPRPQKRKVSAICKQELMPSCTKNQRSSLKEKNKVTGICVKEGSQIPKAREIAATLDASAGITADKIISYANCSGYSMLDNNYRLTRDSDVNITDSIL